MVTYLTSFERALGDLNSEFYRDIIRRSNPSIFRQDTSPVRKTVEEIIEISTALGYHWENKYPEAGSLVSSVIWHLDMGNLREALKELELLLSVVEDEDETSNLLPIPKSQIFKNYEESLLKLLKLLSMIPKDEAILMVEELTYLTCVRRASMARNQAREANKIRTFADNVWNSGATYATIGDFLASAEPLLKGLYPMEQQSWTVMRRREVEQLLNRLRELREEKEVLELWDNLTSD